MATNSDPPSGASTPRFMSQSTTAEDLLKNQTVGLVALSDFRKRRADALEAKEREAQDRAYGKFRASASGTATPDVEGDGALNSTTTATEPPRKKPKKKAKQLLSFGDDDNGEGTSAPVAGKEQDFIQGSPRSSEKEKSAQRKLLSNPNTALPAPKAMTKAALQAEAVDRERLRKEFLAIQEAVKATEIVIPFVFYDGTNTPGGTVKLKKGDHVWLFLERCRKVGAALGVSGGSGSGSGLSSNKTDNRKAWARVGVDDLMCVRGDVIVPHHYEFYYFIANKVQDPSRPNNLLFDYANTAETKKETAEPVLIRRPGEQKLEGEDHDPSITKVVDRRWYLKNKHIYPATLWKEYEAGKEFEEKMANMRRDGEGNSFFYS